jgi:hypothetical protein
MLSVTILPDEYMNSHHAPSKAIEDQISAYLEIIKTIMVATFRNVTFEANISL